MPADQEFSITIGRDGLNLRDQPAEVPVSQLTDSLNWRIDENGALVKRLGYVTYADSAQLAAVPLEQATYDPAGGQTMLLFYCADGHVYKSPGDGTFTSIATGLSTSARPSFATLNDVIYWGNGSDGLRSYDGTTVATIAGAPHGRYLTVWRNRLWISGDDTHPRRVYWSNILDPTTWAALNYVDVDEAGHGDHVTGLITAPNIGQGFDGSDGVLVYMRHSTHRIFDDTDNTAGAVIGGGNVLVDGGTGTSSHRSLVSLNGRVFSICPTGIYSTDGHGLLRIESGRLGSFFRDGVNEPFLSSALGIAWRGAYWAAVPVAGAGTNTTILEVYASYPTGQDGQHPIMAMTLPASAWSVYPDPTGAQLIFCDSTSGQTRWVRQYGVGGADTTGAATANLVTASARSGSSVMGTPRPKRVRRIQALGRGTLTIGVTAELERGVGETRTFLLPTSQGPFWNQVNWNQFVWGPLGGVITTSQWYTQRGRLFGFTVTETSTDSSATAERLGGASAATGGAALYALTVRTTPLDSE